MTHNGENAINGNDTGLTWVLELADKDIKLVTNTLFHIHNTLET